MNTGAGRGLRHVLAKVSLRLLAIQLFALPLHNLANLEGAKTINIFNAAWGCVNAR